MTTRDRGLPDPSSAPVPSALVRNFLWLAFGEGIGRLIALGVVLYLARTLGAASFGLLGSASALVTYFNSMVGGGASYKGTREVARTPEDTAQIVRVNAAAQLVCAAGCFAVLAALLAWTPAAPAGEVGLVVVYSLSMIGVALNPDWALRGLQKMRVIALGEILHQAALAALIVLIVRGAATPLPHVAGAYVMASAIAVAFYYAALRHLGHRRAGGLDWRAVLRTARETTTISLGRLPRLLYLQGDVLLLAWLASAAVAGQFLASHRMILTFVLVGGLVRISVFPKASQLAVAAPSEVGRVQMTALRNEWLVFAPVWVACWVYADPLIALLYGPGYPQSGAVLRIMLLTVPIVGMSFVLQDLLAVAHRDRTYLVANVLTMLLHLGIAIALIRSNGAGGAAIASLIAELAGTLLLYLWRDPQTLPSAMLGPPLRTLAAALAMLVATELCASALPWLALPLGALVFAIAALGLRAVSIEELRRMIAEISALASERRRC
jgi:PST family polysaccharide transporter